MQTSTPIELPPEPSQNPFDDLSNAELWWLAAFATVAGIAATCLAGGYLVGLMTIFFARGYASMLLRRRQLPALSFALAGILAVATALLITKLPLLARS